MGGSYVLLTLCYTRYDIGSYIYILSSQGSQVAILRRQRTTRTASSANLKLSPQGRSYVMYGQYQVLTLLGVISM